MLISYGTNFTEHPGQPYSVQDCTDFFVKAYNLELDRKNNWKKFNPSAREICERYGGER